MQKPLAVLGVGVIIDNTYKIVERIGGGGMGEVFRAQHLQQPWQEVAIKVLLELGGDSIARFQREANATAQLEHPNIVAMHGFDTLPDGTPYIVLEYLRGEDLSHRLKRGAIALDAAQGILQQICAGLEEAHKAGIVHRDLKPANIFLCESPEGSPPIVKILDFGISKVQGATTLTNISEIIGTPQYMAPEQVTGDNHLIGTATDVFSLGVITYQMLTGNLAFPSDNLNQAIFNIVCREPVALLQCCPTLPKGVATAVEAALLKPPDMRLQTPAEFIAALDAAVAGEVWESPTIAIIEQQPRYPGFESNLNIRTAAPTVRQGKQIGAAAKILVEKPDAKTLAEKPGVETLVKHPDAETLVDQPDAEKLKQTDDEKLKQTDAETLLKQTDAETLVKQTDDEKLKQTDDESLKQTDAETLFKQTDAETLVKQTAAETLVKQPASALPAKRTHSKVIGLSIALIALPIVALAGYWQFRTPASQPPPAVVASEAGNLGVSLLAQERNRDALEALGKAFFAGDKRPQVMAALLSSLRREEYVLASVGEGNANSGGISPSGSEFFSVSLKGRLQRFNFQGQPIGEAIENVRSAAYDHSGDRLAVYSPDNVLTVVSRTGKALPITKSIQSFSWLGSSSQLLTTDAGKGSRDLEEEFELGMALWDSDSGRILWKFKSPRWPGRTGMPSVAFSSDNTIMISADLTLQIIDAATGEILQEVSPLNTAGDRKPLPGVAVAPNGRWVAVADYQGGLLLFERATGKSSVLQRSGSSVLDLAVSEDGVLVATFISGETYAFSTDNIGLERPSRVLLNTGSNDQLYCGVATPFCALFSVKGDVRVINPHHGRVLRKFMGPKYAYVIGLVGDKLLTLGQGVVQLQSLPTPLKLHENLRIIELSHDGRRIITSPNILGEKNMTYLVDRVTGDVLQSLSGKSWSAQQGRWLAHGSDIYNTESNKRVVRLDESRIVAGSPANPHFLGLRKNEFVLLEASTGKTLMRFDRDQEIEFFGAKWSNDGGRILVFGVEDSRRLVRTSLDIEKGSTFSFSLQTSGLNALSPNGKEYIQSQGHGIEIFNTEDGSLVTTIDIGFVSVGFRYLSDTQILIIGSDNGTGRTVRTGVMDTTTQTWNSDWNICDYTDIVRASNAPIAAASCMDGVVRVFDIDTKQVLARFGEGGSEFSSFLKPALSADGKVLTVSYRGSLQSWEVLPTADSKIEERLAAQGITNH